MKILHLYPNLMNLYGDHGNITVLSRYLKDLGIRVKVEKKDIEDLIDFNQYDFIYMGSGTEDKLKIAMKDLMKYKLFISRYISKGKAGLFTGNAMELPGRKIDDEEALGILNFETVTTEKRYTGDVIARNEETKEVVGFINKSSLIKGGEADKLFTYEFRDSNLVDNDYEGYRTGNFFGTHIIGPVLVKNPAFREVIVKILAGEKFEERVYPYEQEAYDNTLQELRKRK